MEQANVSIVVPCYGEYYHYLPECIESIKRQTVAPLEVLFDSTPNVAEARNKMIKLAKGEYILCLDADDTLRHDFIEKTVGYDEIVSTEMQEFGERNNHLPAQDRLELRDFLEGNRINCSAVFKKKWIEDIGYWDESTELAGYCDWELWIRMLNAGHKVKIIKEPLFNYRIHADSMTTESDENHVKMFDYIKRKHENLYHNPTIFGN